MGFAGFTNRDRDLGAAATHLQGWGESKSSDKMSTIVIIKKKRFTFLKRTISEGNKTSVSVSIASREERVTMDGQGDGEINLLMDAGKAKKGLSTGSRRHGRRKDARGSFSLSETREGSASQ